MNNKSNTLLCTFTTVKHVKKVIGLIFRHGRPASVYVLGYEKSNESEERDDREILLTYNVNINTLDALKANVRNTISIHRHKETNTFYTINALNTAIKSENDGQSGPQFKLDWEKYPFSILLNDKDTGELVVRSTTLIDIKHNKYSDYYDQENNPRPLEATTQIPY